MTHQDRHLLQALRANVARACLIAAAVGSILVLINHGDHLMDEPVCAYFWLKLALCYLVPFSVSMVSAVLATRRPSHGR